eukprot:GHRR01027201.1.p1 GENE.GHRR01027201.1~~GHRR01027201.1.p1  ORF type:complete len:120 (+),score=10.10 GHRR01027201.1:313-672(+)
MLTSTLLAPAPSASASADHSYHFCWHRHKSLAKDHCCWCSHQPDLTSHSLTAVGSNRHFLSCSVKLTSALPIAVPLAPGFAESAPLLVLLAAKPLVDPSCCDKLRFRACSFSSGSSLLV